MTTFSQFSARCRMRHDFDDQIQVRYRHVDGVDYDTWVSGTEALQRLEALDSEEQLRSLRHLKQDDLRLVLHSLPDATRKMLHSSLRDMMADRLETTIGGNPIGDALSDAVRGQNNLARENTLEKDRWLALMHFEPFRQKVLELAWIDLEGSFPDVESGSEPDDWI